MPKNDALWKASSLLVSETKNAVLSTADHMGRPHSTWMNIVADSSMETVVSVTAPTTHKVSNLRNNPHAEWMIASPSLESMVYLSGPTRVIEGEEAKTYWDSIPSKSKGYYKNYCDEDDYQKFSIILTQVEKIIYCRPPGYKQTTVYEVQK
ncbi:MAG: pyridoxamine 5'-phosphate oxidase family protein [Akkermansiaceae bacterium]